MAELSGIICACLTPFNERDCVDYGALEREIQYIVEECGVDAISIAAVEAAEYTRLTIEERKDLLRRAVEMVDRRLPTIAGCSHQSFRVVGELCEFAAGIGADYAQVLMPTLPWGGNPEGGELVEYFTEVATRSPLPIVAYHNPGPGADPDFATFVKLSTNARVHYFKESSRDTLKIARMIEEIQRAGNAGYFTTMQPLLMTLMMGGAGATMPPPGAKIGARVVKAHREGDFDEAHRWQRLYAAFPSKWPQYGLPPVMKAALQEIGVDIGRPARPYLPVTPADRLQIRELLREAGLL
ncbi:MAG: dihydrodipicolinate synthase family protein [Chloroflexi bacterium]|nr:dihydrodipicolinate synthase family protein [Chloroflexota bacterium]